MSMGFLLEGAKSMHAKQPQVLVNSCRLTARDLLFSFISIETVLENKIGYADFRSSSADDLPFWCFFVVGENCCYYIV